MASLLINADDFGLHSSVNKAITKCVEQDVVNSVSVITNGEACDFEALRGLGRFKIFTGLHLTWIGEPWLTEKMLIPDWRSLIMQLLTRGKSFRQKLLKEADAQITLLLRNNIYPDHIDSHQHVHIFPSLWSLTRELQIKYNISRIRVPVVCNLQLRRQGLPGLALNTLSKQHSHESNFTCAGLRYTGNYDTTLFEQELALCAGRDTELIVHPGSDNSLLNQRYSAWRFDWEKEFKTLTDERFKQSIADHGFRLLRTQ